MADAALMFIDTETSGLIDRARPLSDPGQPWIVSIAAELAAEDGTPLAHFATQIRADGRKIKPGAEAVHGITNRDAGRGGVGEAAALGLLIGLINQVPAGGRVIGYGLAFDRDVVLGLLMRKSADKAIASWSRPGLEWVDLIEPSSQFCRIPSEHVPDTYRWPSLDEAGEALCGLPRRVGHHGAFDDATRAKAVYLELVRRGAIEPLAIGRAAR